MTTTKRKPEDGVHEATGGRNGNPGGETARMLKTLIGEVDAAVEHFNAGMTYEFGEAFIDLPGEFRSQVERIDGALSAARDYVEFLAGGIR